MKFIVIIQKKTEKLVENREQYFLIKNKDDKNLNKEFETWKKQAKEKITKLKHGELTEDEVYKWLQENK